MFQLEHFVHAELCGRICIYNRPKSNGRWELGPSLPDVSEVAYGLALGGAEC